MAVAKTRAGLSSRSNARFLSPGAATIRRVPYPPRVRPSHFGQASRAVGLLLRTSAHNSLAGFPLGLARQENALSAYCERYFSARPCRGNLGDATLCGPGHLSVLFGACAVHASLEVVALARTADWSCSGARYPCDRLCHDLAAYRGGSHSHSDRASLASRQFGPRGNCPGIGPNSWTPFGDRQLWSAS